MNESQTRLDKIDPALRTAGWGKVADSRIITEYRITNGRISRTSRQKPLSADYILSYKGVKLAVVEAKSDEKDVSDGVAQAKLYAGMLNIRYTYATNGDALYEMDMQTGSEGDIDKFPTPDELWKMTFGDVDEWRDKFYAQPLYSNGTKEARYYQEIAINKALDAIAKDRKRILLTLATGTGKTYIAFQICYKLFHAKWNVKKTGNRPRILFLADRNILANQAKGGFFGFAPDALVRISPDEVRKCGKVPTNGSVFFSIFQTFMTDNGTKYTFGEYPRDFFDIIIIDECHRGGANDESSWREIMNWFAPAVQIGLTATPRRDLNADTYKYFGEPVYTYSLRQGIADGFLTPFRHCRMQGTIDDYIYTPEDLQKKWSSPKTRDELLEKMDEAGYGREVLKQIRTLIDAENCDLLDVLEYISFNVEPMERTERVKKVEGYRAALTDRERDFVNFIINLYVREGVDELSTDRLPAIVAMKYGSVPDGMKALGGVNVAKKAFLNFQRAIYLN